MAYIIAEPCVGTCDTACVEVCPVDCIHGPELVSLVESGGQFTPKDDAGAEAKESGFDATDKTLYIDPEECIDCGACEPECPVEAIFEEDEVPAEWEKFIKLNYDYFGREYNG
jgi:ferredoxin